jgi:electron transfer flavoprotein alpha subunit
MSVLVVIESLDGKIKKSSREAVSYAAAIGGDVTAVCLEKVEESELATVGKNGAGKVLVVSTAPETVEASASVLAAAFTSTGVQTVVFSKSPQSSAVAGRLAIKIDASTAINVVGLPETSEGFSVRTSIFTGNAFANVNLLKENKILVVNKNVVDIKEDGAETSVEVLNVETSEGDNRLKVLDRDKATGKILLPEADIVVSGGRGLKGPENWAIIEDLAGALGAATGCSKPVSDMDWRPHSEHVGQTGIKVSPSLYIAVGISGAIQHLAGVNSSKYIVVINTDEEAPFFKAADYGIVGDAFEVLPQLTAAIQAQK